METKICVTCEIEKPILMYYRDYTTIHKQGYRSKCKECTKKHFEQRKPREKTDIVEKKCNICNLTKDINNFLKSTRHKDGYMSCCKPCHYAKSENKGCYPKIKRTPEYMKEYWKKRTSELQYKMKKNIQRSIHFQLKNKATQSYQRNDNTIGYLGCSIDFFKFWIQSCFDENMSWSNYATYWELDHVKPCASFDFNDEKQLYNCFNWSNYQPLYKKENRSKSCNIDIDKITQHSLRAKMFLEKNKSIICFNNYYSLIKLLPVGESPTVDKSTNAVN